MQVDMSTDYQKMKDYYLILEIDRNADFRTVKKAYFRRAKECHPDLFPNDTGKEEEFKELVEAFDILSDPVSRYHYDNGEWERRSVNSSNTSYFHFGFDAEAIMDSLADDVLEEMIVGNTIPRKTTLQTLMCDLGNTQKFCHFRYAKNLFYSGNVREAQIEFEQAVEWSPLNILYRYYLGKSCAVLSNWRAAEKHFCIALQIGVSRHPPQQLNRIRKELASVYEKKKGLFARFFRKKVPAPTLSCTPEEQLRNRAGREMDRLERRSEYNNSRLNP